ncbi:hypothetical protein ACVWZ3_009854 [Bradyrhizobium sp. i1.3.6]
MEHDRVARLDVALGDVLLRQRRLDVSRGDLLPRIHHAALERDHVEQMRAGEDRLKLLDAKLLEPVCVANFCSCEAIVESHLALVAVLAELDSNMAEAVELRTGLADLGGQEFVVIDHLIVTERAAGRAAGNAQCEYTRTKQRHGGFVDRGRSCRSCRP